MDLHSQCLYVIRSVGSSGEVRQVELNLVPSYVINVSTFVQSHWHCADEGLHPRCRLIVRCSEPSPYVLIVQDLHFEGEILFELSVGGSTFLMLMTRKVSLMPRVSLSFWGQVMRAVVTLVPMISSTEDWMS